MSSERDLITRLLRDRDLTTLSDKGITSKFFLDFENRQAFEAVLAHQSKYGVVPPEATFRADYPTYKFTKAEDALAFYADRVVHDYSKHVLEIGLADAVDLWEANDPIGSRLAIARLQNQLNQEIAGSRVSDLTLTGSQRMERYRAYSLSSGALKGISSGFASIDAATGGFQRKQLITMVGPPKAGKSTMMLLADMAAHKSFYRPLFIGFEMSNEEQEERHDAIRAQVSAQRLREGNLTMAEMQQLEKMTRRLELMPPLIFSEDANSTLTLSGVAAQIEKHKPDILFVDGVYMMDDENGERKGSPQAITNLTRGFKQMVKNFDIPGAISTQVLEWKMDRKKGVTSSSIGYSSSFIQDSDHVIAVENTDDEDVKKVKIVMSRNNAGMETYVKWDWDKSTFEEMEEYEPPTEDDDTPPKF